MAKQFGLGKGLGALLPTEEKESKSVTELPIDTISYSPYQPRTKLDDSSLAELAQSLKRSGVIQPIVVRKVDGSFELIAGERRIRAARIAGFEKIPVVIRDISDNDAAEFALVENIQREDLNPIDIARAMKRLREDFGYTQESIAEGVKKSRPYVTNLLRLLELPDIVQEAILKGEISEGHGRALLALKDDDMILSGLEQVITEKLSVRQTEKLVKSIPTIERKKVKPIKKTTTQVQAEGILRDTLGTKVKVGHKSITIEYYNPEDLIRICDMIASISVN